jgi:hypothetical protein
MSGWYGYMCTVVIFLQNRCSTVNDLGWEGVSMYHGMS